jgi:hypothetical protein
MPIDKVFRYRRKRVGETARLGLAGCLFSDLRINAANHILQRHARPFPSCRKGHNGIVAAPARQGRLASGQAPDDGKSDLAGRRGDRAKTGSYCVPTEVRRGGGSRFKARKSLSVSNTFIDHLLR